MNILGLETSCDETGAAVVHNGRTILSNVIASSLKFHKKYGGVVPEIASRHQLECVKSIVQQSLEEADLLLSDIDAVAVTESPGLVGSLLVGLSFARALSFAIGKPLVEVNHVHAHLYANFLAEDKAGSVADRQPPLPAVGLVVSGGHTSLYFIKDFKKFQLIGQTRDDAAGEAFDKVAKILNLGYPGGPIIDRLAQQGQNRKLKFNCARLEKTHDFSFSGIKTAVLYHVRDNAKKKDFSLNKIAYSFQNSVVNNLVEKSIHLCQLKKVKTLLVGGGVAVNSFLRVHLIKEGQRTKVDVFFPSLKLCSDNGAMIAGLGYHALKNERSKS